MAVAEGTARGVDRTVAGAAEAGDGRTGRLGYLPALDGLRGLAVAAVLLFHAGLTQVPGGHLGVSAFFTLSGFLITGLLLAERYATGRVALKAFWGRRARRLVPAMLLTFPVVAVLLRLTDEALPRGVLGDAVAAVTWTANWRFIASGQTYGDLFALPSPFQHFWSLAVEEQYYLVFPLLFLLLVGRPGALVRRARLALVLAGLVVASTLQAAHLQTLGGALSRAYYGTDARVAEILVGALLAVALVGPAGLRRLSRPASRAVGLAGLAGLAGLLVAFATVEKGDPALYRGGLLAVAVATAAVVAAAVQPRSAVSRLLSLAPAVQLGRISYGVYLYHWPVFLLLSERYTGLNGTSLLSLRLGATLALAWLSYVLVETPIRRGRLTALPSLTGWANAATAAVAVVAVVVAQLTFPSSTPASAGASPLAAAGGGTTSPGSAAPGAPALAAAGRLKQSASATSPGHPGTTATPGAAQPGTPSPSAAARHATASSSVPSELVADPNKTPVPPVPTVQPGQLKVVVVGDSIGNNFGVALLTWAKERSDVVAYNLAIPACTLTRGGQRRITPGVDFPIKSVCRWWDDPTNPRRQALEQFAPDVIVVEDGINEVFDRKQDSWATWRQPKDASYNQWLNQEYAAAVNQWTPAKAKVLVMNTPCANWQRYEVFSKVTTPALRISEINLNVYDPMPRVSHADLFNRVCPGGQYTDTIEGIPNGRPDGFHFSDEAGAALARNWLGPLVLQAAKGPVSPLGRTGLS